MSETPAQIIDRLAAAVRANDPEAPRSEAPELPRVATRIAQHSAPRPRARRLKRTGR